MNPLTRSAQIGLLTALAWSGFGHPVHAQATASKSAGLRAPARAHFVVPLAPLPGGRIAVQARINGSVAGTFLVDTGSSATIITDTMAVKLGLKSIAAGQGTLGGKPATFVWPLKLQIGDLTIHSQACPIVPAQIMAARTGSAAIDGLIGMQTLRYFALDIDAARHQMTLYYPGNLTRTEVKQAGFGSASIVPLIPDPPKAALFSPAAASYWTLRYLVSARLSSGAYTARQNLILDTGSGSTIFSSRTVQTLRLKPLDTIEEPDMTTTGMIYAYHAEAALLTVGNIHLANPVIGVFEDKRNPVEMDGFGLLGCDVLSCYHVLIDFAAKKMYLKPNAQASLLSSDRRYH